MDLDLNFDSIRLFASGFFFGVGTTLLIIEQKQKKI